jgi:hypothetical protein
MEVTFVVVPPSYFAEVQNWAFRQAANMLPGPLDSNHSRDPANMTHDEAQKTRQKIYPAEEAEDTFTPP